MDSNGIKVELEDLGILSVKCESKRQIAHKIADKYLESVEARKLAQEIISEIDKDEIKELVLNGLVDRALDALVDSWMEDR